MFHAFYCPPVPEKFHLQLRLYPILRSLISWEFQHTAFVPVQKVRDDREELSKMVQELLIINLVMSALSYAVYFAAIYYVPRFRQDKELFLIIGLTIFFNAIGMEWLYKALEQYTYITVRSIIFKFIAIVAMFLMVHEQSDYVIYGGISILASSASNIFNFFHIHRYINIKPVGHYNF